jgi:flagellar L-ring protein precursor FlgH
MKKLAICLLFVTGVCHAKRPPEPSPLDQMIAEAQAANATAPGGQPGSLWRPGAALGDIATDLRARNIHDLVTVVVFDRASAVAKGSVTSARSSSARSSVSALGGQRTGILPELLNLGSETSLDGQGTTTRETVLRTTLTARVTHVLPNGNLVVEGLKTVRVNAETQTITVRGVVRPVDVSPGNSIYSDQLSMLEVAVNGRGVVGDAIRRPNFLYRILLGLLPF